MRIKFIFQKSTFSFVKLNCFYFVNPYIRFCFVERIWKPEFRCLCLFSLLM